MSEAVVIELICGIIFRSITNEIHIQLNSFLLYSCALSTVTFRLLP